MKTCGVLALQGDFDAHCRAVERAGGKAVEVRSKADLECCDSLIIPGGESTTMLKLLEEEALVEPIRKFSEQHPVYGSCAGAILLAQEVSHPAQPGLGLIDIGIERNAYGRQVDSRIVEVSVESGKMEAVFIRAPIIRRAGATVRTLASYQGNPVWVEQGLHMVTTFHPELTSDLRVHQHLLEKSGSGKA